MPSELKPMVKVKSIITEGCSLVPRRSSNPNPSHQRSIPLRRTCPKSPRQAEDRLCQTVLTLRGFHLLPHQTRGALKLKQSSPSQRVPCTSVSLIARLGFVANRTELCLRCSQFANPPAEMLSLAAGSCLSVLGLAGSASAMLRVAPTGWHTCHEQRGLP